MRVEGTVEKLNRAESEDYFHSRPPRQPSQRGDLVTITSRYRPNRVGKSRRGSGTAAGGGAGPLARRLGWLSPRPNAIRVLAGTFKPAARSSRLHPARERLANRTVGTLTSRLASNARCQPHHDGNVNTAPQLDGSGTGALSVFNLGVVVKREVGKLSNSCGSLTRSTTTNPELESRRRTRFPRLLQLRQRPARVFGGLGRTIGAVCRRPSPRSRSARASL